MTVLVFKPAACHSLGRTGGLLWNPANLALHKDRVLTVHHTPAVPARRFSVGIRSVQQRI